MPQHFAEVKKSPIRAERKGKQQILYIFLTDKAYLWLCLIQWQVTIMIYMQSIKSTEELFSTLKGAKVSTDGLFVNADSGFDSKDFRSICAKWGVIPNVAFNYRNGEIKDKFLLDDLLYKQRYAIERTNAWMDSFRSLLNRFDVTVSSWKSFNYIAFMIILFKKIKNKKSR